MFLCSHCLKYSYVATENNTEEERNLEENDSSLICKVCNATFSSEEGLSIHMERNFETGYYCCACKKIFSGTVKLEIHYRTHTGEQPYACGICGKRFSVDGNLKKVGVLLFAYFVHIN